MADAIHYLVQTRLSFVAPYFQPESMERLYTKTVAVNVHSTCARWLYDVIENAL